MRPYLGMGALALSIKLLPKKWENERGWNSQNIKSTIEKRYHDMSEMIFPTK